MGALDILRVEGMKTINSVEVEFDSFFSAKPLKRNLNSYCTP
jgi:hypothetical protein